MFHNYQSEYRVVCQPLYFCEPQVREYNPFVNRFMKIEKMLMVPAG
jgi:hypothetical protein